MVLHISSETVSFWSPPPGLQEKSTRLQDMRNRIRHRPASIKYSRRKKSGENAPEKSHLPTASGLKMNECLLSTVRDWDFNVFNLDKLTNGRSLFHLTLHLFQEHDLINTFKLDIVKLMRCITLIEEGYHASNPYHNATHAADVVQAMHVFLQEPRVAASLTPLDRLTALLAAATHDLDHPGVNQAFLIATGNHLAALYNNTSVLENHHWRSAVGVLRETGLVEHFSHDSLALLESQLRGLILATDITRQPEFLGRFKKHMDACDLDVTQQSHRFFLMQIALKCADISNPCRPWQVSKRWSHQVCDEFFKQGDYERKLSLPVTSLCDREATTVAKIQIGFMKFVVEPLFREWQRFNDTPLSDQLLANVAHNANKWASIEAGEDDKDDDLKALPPTFKISPSSSPGEEEEEEAEEEEGEGGEASAGGVGDEEGAVTMPAPGPGESGPQSGGPPRRHSMPKVSALPGGGGAWGAGGGIAGAGLRRHSLPVVVALSVSVDKLSDKLAMIAESCLPLPPTNGNKKPSLVSFRTNITQLGQSLDEHAMERGSEAGTTITSAHGLDHVLPPPHRAPRQASKPQPPAATTTSTGQQTQHPPAACSSLKDTVKLYLPSQHSLRRASVPYDKSESDAQPLLMTIHPTGEVLARRHSDVPRSPGVTGGSGGTSSCYFSSRNSLLASAVTKAASSGGDNATTPLLLASHDSLPSLQV